MVCSFNPTYSSIRQHKDLLVHHHGYPLLLFSRSVVSDSL